MTVEVARRRTRKTTKAAAPPAPIGASESISIGEIEQTVFPCPNCQRPLAIGARHCPGCRTHLVNRVQLSKASLFVMFGIVVGLAVGGALGGVGLLGNSASRDAEIAAAVSAALAAAKAQPAPVASAMPLASSRPLATAKPDGGSAGIPSLTRAALVQAAGVHAQMAAAVPVLQSALAARDFDTYTVFQVLRSVSADATTGRQLAAHIGDWSGGVELETSLMAFYKQVSDTSDAGLDASIRNKAAYKAAAAAMVSLLGGIATLDGQVRAVATEAGVTIPAAEAP
jgi:hypothetical protein